MGVFNALEQCWASNQYCSPNWRPPSSHCNKIFSQKSDLRSDLGLFFPSSFPIKLEQGRVCTGVVWAACLQFPGVLCVFFCTLLPYGGCISPPCKHSWLPPVAAWVNSSLPADTKSPNRRITFSASALIWLLGTLGFMVCYL